MARQVVQGYSGPPMVRCRAHRTDGEPCKRWAIRGGAVCPSHGGAAPAVRRKAAARIEASLDRAAAAVVLLMEDPATPHAIKLAAAKDLLDRGGLTGRQMEPVQLAPWQIMLSQVVVASETDREPRITVAGETAQPTAPRAPATPLPRADLSDRPPRHLDPDNLAGARRTRPPR